MEWVCTVHREYVLRIHTYIRWIQTMAHGHGPIVQCPLGSWIKQNILNGIVKMFEQRMKMKKNNRYTQFYVRAHMPIA